MARLHFALPLLLLTACGSSGTTTSQTSARELLSLSSAGLGSAYVGDPYSGSVAATGGTAPYNVRLVSGKLPEGLSFKGGGSATISGTPLAAGSSTFRLEVVDANLSVRSQEFNMTVSELPPLNFEAALPVGEVRGETRVPLRVVGPRQVRAARYTWDLPAGVKVTKVQPEESAVSGRPALAWKQAGQRLTLDFGFRASPKNGALVALISLKPVDAPFTLSAQNGSSVTALDGRGQSIRDTSAPGLAPDRPKDKGGEGAASGPIAAPTSDSDGGVNGDGEVNLTDLALLMGNYGKSGQGDLNRDGRVDESDVQIFMREYRLP